MWMWDCSYKYALARIWPEIVRSTDYRITGISGVRAAKTELRVIPTKVSGKS